MDSPNRFRTSALRVAPARIDPAEAEITAIDRLYREIERLDNCLGGSTRYRVALHRVARFRPAANVGLPPTVAVSRLACYNRHFVLRWTA